MLNQVSYRFLLHACHECGTGLPPFKYFWTFDEWTTKQTNDLTTLHNIYWKLDELCSWFIMKIYYVQAVKTRTQQRRRAEKNNWNSKRNDDDTGIWSKKWNVSYRYQYSVSIPLGIDESWSQSHMRQSIVSTTWFSFTILPYCLVQLLPPPTTPTLKLLNWHCFCFVTYKSWCSFVCLVLVVIQQNRRSDQLNSNSIVALLAFESALLGIMNQYREPTTTNGECTFVSGSLKTIVR